MIDPTGFLPMYTCKSDFNCGGGPNGSGDMGYNGLVGTDPNYQLTSTSTTVTTTYSDGTTSSFIIPDAGDSNIGSPPASGGGAPNSAQSPTGDAPQSIGGAVADLLGKIWNLPNDAIGLVFGGLGYVVGWAAYELGASWQPNAPTIGFDGNALQFGNNPLMVWGLGLTFGNVESFSGNPGDYIPYTTTQVEQHEDQHTIQGQVMGPLYLPSYIIGGIGSLIFGGGDPVGPGNWMEAGPYNNPPQPWPWR